MALKTFNINADIYEEFSKHCKAEGISMSKKVEKFIKEELERIKNSGDNHVEEMKNISGHVMSKYC